VPQPLAEVPPEERLVGQVVQVFLALEVLALVQMAGVQAGVDRRGDEAASDAALQDLEVWFLAVVAANDADHRGH